MNGSAYGLRALGPWLHHWCGFFCRVPRKRTPEKPPFHPTSGSLDSLLRSSRVPLRWDPSASCRHLFGANDHGRLRSNRNMVQPLRGLDCRFSRLFASGCPGLHLRSSRSLLRPWMCHHMREPTVLSIVSAQPCR